MNLRITAKRIKALLNNPAILNIISQKGWSL